MKVLKIGSAVDEVRKKFLCGIPVKLSKNKRKFKRKGERLNG